MLLKTFFSDLRLVRRTVKTANWDLDDAIDSDGAVKTVGGNSESTFDLLNCSIPSIEAAVALGKKQIDLEK